jgi:hypothetical protein
MRSGGASPEISTTSSSPASRLPQEIVEMIIVHLIYDTRSLLACSLTCYSWYIATVPHLHHTLITPAYHWSMNKKFMWPKPLRNMHKLGLLSLVKKFQIEVDHLRAYHFRRFSSTRFNCCTLRHFFALTNVQELGIDHLDIPSFMPRIQRYFQHLSPTVRSLTLREPKGSRRQILYFIGLFEHLEDLKLLYDYNGVKFQEEPADDQTLVPPFVPPLRGRLTIMYFTRVGLLEEMIDLFGGIRFRYMDLYDVDGTRLLLNACAETLESLRLYPPDPRGKELALISVRTLVDSFAAISSLRDFDLSRSKSLRTLEIWARYFDDTYLLIYALSTITSPVFSEVTLFYRDLDIHGVKAPMWPNKWPTLRPVLRDERAKEAACHEWRFNAFRKMHKVRNFQLVLCADVWDGVGRYVVRMLKQGIAAEKAKRGFDSIFPEPPVIYSPRGSGQDWYESWGGTHGPWIPL